MRRSWLDYSSSEIDAAVERQHERALARYEAEQDRLAVEQERREAEYEEALGGIGADWGADYNGERP